MPSQTSFVEEHLKEARKRKASLAYHWLAYISKGTQPATNAEQSNTTQAVNDSKSNNNHPMDKPAAQTVQNRATASEQVAKRGQILRKHLQQSKGARKG